MACLTTRSFQKEIFNSVSSQLILNNLAISPAPNLPKSAVLILFPLKFDDIDPFLFSPQQLQQKSVF